MGRLLRKENSVSVSFFHGKRHRMRQRTSIESDNSGRKSEGVENVYVVVDL